MKPIHNQFAIGKNTRIKNSMMLVLIASLAGVLGCSSIDLPTLKESQQAIDRIQPQIARADEAIRVVANQLPKGNDFVSTVRLSAINRFLERIAGQRADDIFVQFLSTRPLIKEDKSVFGLKYTNFLDIDSGIVRVNLREFRLQQATHNVVQAKLLIEGKGRITASGTYTGIPARVSPEMNLRLDESISLTLSATDTGTIVLAPQKKTLMLKATFTVSLLEWRIPWNQEIPLEVTDLIAPIAIPAAFRSEIPFPLPATKFGSERVEFVPHVLEMSGLRVAASGDAIELRSNVTMKKKVGR